MVGSLYLISISQVWLSDDPLLYYDAHVLISSVMSISIGFSFK